MTAKTRQRMGYAAMLALSAATALLLYPIINRPAVLLHQADELLKEGHIEAADAIILQAVEAGLRRPASVIRAARIFLDEGRAPKAADLLNDTLTDMRTIPQGLGGQMAGLLDSYGLPAEALHIMQRTEPDRRTREEWLYLADLLRRQKRYDEAVEAYDRLLSDTPSDTEAALRRVETLSWQGDLAAALPPARELVRNQPDNRAARLLLARILYWSGYVDEAEAQYKRLLGDNL